MTTDTDVEMPTERPAEDIPLVVNDIKQGFAYLEQAVSNFDPRFTLKVLRGLPALRKRVDVDSLTEIIDSSYPEKDPSKAILLKAIGGNASGSVQSVGVILPEVDIYLHLLVAVWLMHHTNSTQFRKFMEATTEKLQSYNRRSLDYLAAKVWFYYSRAFELSGALDQIRPTLLAALRTATLRHDGETQASIITLLLRNYLSSHQVSQAANLVAKAPFPESAANALTARYYYYLARINAIQLNYTAAFENVTSAIRKAPQTQLAVGFLQTAYKLSIVTELLMGDIPARNTFQEPELERSLAPYFDVVSAVRLGDINQFAEVLTKHGETLKRDGTYTLVLRLRQNVIKTGIRIMSLTYSRISLKDICLRLLLDSEESAEYVVAKAIRDGDIDATINHERGYMQSNEVLDIYSTTQPQDTLHERIRFCITLHDESVKSMRYLANDHRAVIRDMEEALEREKDLISEVVDDDDDDADMDL